jgi:hypothetical protein
MHRYEGLIAQAGRPDPIRVSASFDFDGLCGYVGLDTVAQEGTRMTRWVLILAALGLAILPSRARAQAAAEYGMAASHSAASTSRLARTLDPKLGARQQNPRSKSIETAMQENLKQLQPKDPKEAGSVHIESTPAKATIFVDGLAVAYTPADFTLAAGKHDIEVKHPVSIPWEKEVSVSRGDKLSLKPELKDKYKSVLSFTVQQ